LVKMFGIMLKTLSLVVVKTIHLISNLILIMAKSA
jgi:hypothetical protein